LINPCRTEFEDVTALETAGIRLNINVPKDASTTSSYMSSASLRIGSDVIITIEDTFNRFLMFANISDFEIMSTLLSKPAVFHALPMALQRAHEFMETIGLRRGDDFEFDVTQWIDDEVEGWNYLQLKVTLFGPGIDKLLERGMDKFALLKNMITMASQVLPQEVRREVIVILE
jgi:hypothetical protein